MNEDVGYYMEKRLREILAGAEESEKHVSYTIASAFRPFAVSSVHALHFQEGLLSASRNNVLLFLLQLDFRQC